MVALVVIARTALFTGLMCPKLFRDTKYVVLEERDSILRPIVAHLPMHISRFVLFLEDFLSAESSIYLLGTEPFQTLSKY